MFITGRKKLTKFIRKHADARSWVRNWLDDVEQANWENPQDIKARYATASFLADQVVFFNVRGDHYRLKVQVAYNSKKVTVQWIGTHEEYSRRFKGGR